MKNIIDYLLTIIYLIHFGLCLLFFHVIQSIAFNVFGKKAHKISVDWLNFFLTYGLYLTGAHVSLKNLASLPDNRPIIFVANHQSTFDIPALIWFLRKYHPRFVSKIELAKGVPSISYNLRKSGAALINRKDGKQAITEIARLGKLIQDEKSSAIIFPEGTRGEPNLSKAFKAGVALVLIDNPHIPYVPIYLKSMGKAMPKGDNLIVPHDSAIVYGTPVKISSNNVTEILEQMKKEIEDLNKLNS